MTRKLLGITMIVGMFLLNTVVGFAGTAQQLVSYEITAINEISVTGDPALLSINAGAAGSAPNSATPDTSTKYSVTTNQSGVKITGSLDSDMPLNTTLQVTLTAPTGASSISDVVLSNTTTQDLVTGIANLSESNLTITYKFSATALAPVQSGNRTVTLTVFKP